MKDMSMESGFQKLWKEYLSECPLEDRSIVMMARYFFAAGVGFEINRASRDKGTNAQATNSVNLPCPADCANNIAGCCLLSANHCIRAAEDFYKQRKAKQGAE